ncbi:hypothetical protein P152DRAFT_460784 [Eremomyces bilateralis CBS 781.70]|uniref:CCZ1/INTU/HSP4 first Longin domain-containing protein n=1 Tax=Eremomyces bilateralis CBS 781.70 TaxID=1392243 RepID=A0A6G1FWV8_9PEZI|nr:uncharacterized protein P152DRAFT_460784 [Eremomyces bilateralis CBS 781.70]KAF1810273.1 hypothetical protein P152DRAFT_460784 [Eremomyces bilateralis CBS 781.70]
MASSSQEAPKVIPAQLSFLAIYNPSLAKSDETFRDQILFYYSRSAKLTRRVAHDDTSKDKLRDEENEKLRQIGLAQGMVAFARGFSGKDTVDSIETEKSRIVVDELESGWWILASIDLTRVPQNTRSPESKVAAEGRNAAPIYEYSSREVSPPLLLLQQLRRAHRLFLLHHGNTLDALLRRLSRTKLCHSLDRFWAKFCSNWDVMLHGSPAVDVFDGIKLAAGGELGMGVGEEEWGSGEREVLEDFASRTDGLVDVMISRFGEPSKVQLRKGRNAAKKTNAKDPGELEPWMGTNRYPGPNDGIVFSGVGNLTRGSIRDVSHWMEWIYSYGESAYGAKESQRSDRRQAKNSRIPSRSPESQRSTSGSSRLGVPKAQGHAPGIPRPIVSPVERSLDTVLNEAEGQKPTEPQSTGAGGATSLGDPDTWVRYLTLGYKSGWGNTDNTSTASQAVSTKPKSVRDGLAEESTSPEMRHLEPQPEEDPYDIETRLRARVQKENRGQFIIGLRGNLEEDDEDANASSPFEDNEESDSNDERDNRTRLRTLQVELSGKLGSEGEEVEPGGDGGVGTRLQVRVVVYVHRPFIYAFLFEPSTPSLSLSTFYRHLHAFFSPLHQPLSNSTSPVRLAARIAMAPHAQTTSTTYGPSPATAKTSRMRNPHPIYHIVHDPTTMSTHTSIPNIPELHPRHPMHILNVPPPATQPPNWSRVEALHVHSQIIATIAATRKRHHDYDPGEPNEDWSMRSEGEKEVERTCRTSRGWWVVWMKMLTAASNDEVDPKIGEGSKSDRSSTTEPATSEPSTGMESETEHTSSESRSEGSKQRQRPSQLVKEAILIRQAGDAAASAKDTRSTSLNMGMGLFNFGTSERTPHSTVPVPPQRLAEGIGVDARSYIDGILGLSM